MGEESAWTPIADDYEKYWKPFDAAYAFNPRYRDVADGPTRPGIIEPPGSVTFSLAPITRAGSTAQWCSGVQALNAEVLRAFVHVFAETERLLVLDWQHQSYWFKPHDHAVGDDSRDHTQTEPWPVTPFPDGDYYIFLSEDLTLGTFGHPWEESLCVFGSSLVDALAPTLSSWLPILRRSDPGSNAT